MVKLARYQSFLREGHAREINSPKTYRRIATPHNSRFCPRKKRFYMHIHESAPEDRDLRFHEQHHKTAMARLPFSGTI
jgi:hypothetical protein